MKLPLPEEFVLYDLEFTAWEGSHKRKWSGPNEYREVIQIGAIRVHDLKEMESLCVYVRPVKNPELSTYITELTGISQNTIDEQGVSFDQALEQFKAFCGQKSVYCFGSDTEVLEENASLLGREMVLSRTQFRDFIQETAQVWRSHGIDLSQYSSGTLHTALSSEPGLRAHDAVNDMRNLLQAITLLEHA